MCLLSKGMSEIISIILIATVAFSEDQIQFQK